MKTGTTDHGLSPPNGPVVTDAAEPDVPSHHHSNSQPPSVPDYELLRCIGRGSYGDVWLARNVLGQFRAVKIIYRSRFIDPRPFEREFEGIQRFEPISRSHPSQLHILHVGKNDAEGCFYYVMELADDGAVSSSEFQVSSSQTPATDQQPETQNSKPETYLSHTLRYDLERHTRLPIPDCVQIALSLATALGHLHEQGLVHRDIKPSNVIFVNGVAKLGDIGLVTDAGDTQSIVGTEGYLPPEGPGTPQADLYSLGKMLYEISTGMDRRRFAELPDDVWTWPDSKAVIEFNEIVLKACAKDPAQRYQTTKQLRADLALLQEGKSVRRLRRTRSGMRLARWVAVLTVVVAFGIMAIRVWHPATTTEAHLRSTNSVANDFYDVGVSLYQKNTEQAFAKATEKFEAAVNADPNFALALAALAMCYSWDSVGTNVNWSLLPKAKGLAERALDLNGTLASAHCSLGIYATFEEWDWPKAESQFQRAVELDPKNLEAHAFRGLLLRLLGRTDEALGEFETAVSLNPRSQVATRFLGFGFMSARRYPEAVARFRKAAELADCPLDFWLLADALSWEGKLDEAIRWLEHASVAYGTSPPKARTEAQALREAVGKSGVAGFRRKRLEIRREDRIDPIDLAGDCAAAGRVEEALDLLDHALEVHHAFLVFDLTTHPQWDPLRSTPKFQALLTKLHLSSIPPKWNLSSPGKATDPRLRSLSREP